MTNITLSISDEAEVLGDEKLLAESWLSKEDEKAFEYLNN